MGEQLNSDRLDFFSECMDSLRKKLPRNYERPTPKSQNSWQFIYKPIESVYFEWAFRRLPQLDNKLGFTVALNFENNHDSSENRKLLELFRPMESSLKAKLGTTVEFDDEWERGGEPWARLYVWTSQTNMDDSELQSWAVKKARILIQECEPILIDGHPHQGHVAPEENFPEELPDEEGFCEGAVVQVLKNQYERDPDARDACLNEYGYIYSCHVCEMSFREEYGQIGDGFIHVHHRVPLAARKAEYRVNPAEDLVPVCPNCHAMLHFGRPWNSPRSTDELREIMRKQRDA